MKKLIRSLLVVLITLSLAVGAYADNFSFLILCENTGYNSDPIYKDANIPHSKAMISVTYTLAKMLSEGQYFYNVIDVTRRTNFIVIASNGVQISNAINPEFPGIFCNYISVSDGEGRISDVTHIPFFFMKLIG